MKQDLKIKKMLWHPAGNLLSEACTLPEACTISNSLGTGAGSRFCPDNQ